MKKNIVRLLVIVSFFFLIMAYFLPKFIDIMQTHIDNDFTPADPQKELPFEKLVGTYKLDANSKKKYNIPDGTNLTLVINEDSTYTVFNYINSKNRALVYRKKSDTFTYDNKPDPYLYSYKLNNGGVIHIYYRKKDNAISLLVPTPFIPATKENNMMYTERDYLQYIKVKDNVKK